MTLWYSKHILSYIEGSQKCIFNAFNASAILLSDRFVTAQQQQQEGVWNSCSWMKMSILVSNPFQHTFNLNFCWQIGLYFLQHLRPSLILFGKVVALDITSTLSS